MAHAREHDQLVPGNTAADAANVRVCVCVCVCAPMRCVVSALSTCDIGRIVGLSVTASPDGVVGRPCARNAYTCRAEVVPARLP